MYVWPDHLSLFFFSLFLYLSLSFSPSPSLHPAVTTCPHSTCTWAHYREVLPPCNRPPSPRTPRWCPRHPRLHPCPTLVRKMMTRTTTLSSLPFSLSSPSLPLFLRLSFTVFLSYGLLSFSCLLCSCRGWMLRVFAGGQRHEVTTRYLALSFLACSTPQERFLDRVKVKQQWQCEDSRFGCILANVLYFLFCFSFVFLFIFFLFLILILLLSMKTERRQKEYV